MASTVQPRKLQGDCITAREIGAETLVYDERSHTAWCLNRSSACIWSLCDGANTVRTIAELAAAELASAVSEDLVRLTLEELLQKGLLEASAGDALPLDPSRRAMLGKAGLAAAALLPAIIAITAPPALAQSGSVGTDSVRRLRRPPLNHQ